MYVDQAASPNVAKGPMGPYVSTQDAIDDLSAVVGSHITYVDPKTYDPIVIDEPICESLRIKRTSPYQAIIDGNNVAPCEELNDYFVGSTLQDIAGLDPLFVDADNRDYSLLWDYENRSPLINAGCEIEGVIQTDPDGTPPDIGAIYYPHQHRKYFTGVSLSNIYWLSFPVVDDRTDTNGQYWNELGYLFEAHMQGPPTYPSQLNQILWSYDHDQAILEYDGLEWLHTGHTVSQPKGYKVQFARGIHPTPVVINGFKANPRTTPVSWVVSVNVNGQMQPFENWVGFFL